MPSSYSSRLRLEKQATGENTDNWGVLLNTLIDLIDSSIAGMATVAVTGGAYSLTANNSVADESRMAILKFTGVLTSDSVVTVPSVAKNYVVWNATSGAYSVTLKTSAGTGVVVAQNTKALLFSDGTNVLAQPGDIPRGQIAGLTLSNNAAATKLDVAAGQATDSTGVTTITLSAAITAGLIQTSGSWTAGNTQNKLDTGARANSTWYHVWAIRKDSDGSGDFLFSLSVSAPTMPSGYTYKRRIGSVRTTSGGDITAFVQNGERFLWGAMVVDASAVTGSASAVSRTLTVPIGVKVKALLRCSLQDSGSFNRSYMVSSLDETDQTPGGGGVIGNLFSTGAEITSAGIEVTTNTSAQIRTRAATTTASLNINTYGWDDTRGRND